MNNIIQEWEQHQLSDKKRPLFFTVRFRTVLTNWENFCEPPIEKYERLGLFSRKYSFEKGQRLSFVTLEEAEELAKDQSVHYLYSITGVFIGDSDTALSLWEDGECLYNNPICAKFYTIDYGPMWR